MAIITGITGSIASGKTTLLNYITDLGYEVFSSDDYVKSLYKRADVIEEISGAFSDMDINNRRAIAKIIYSNPIKKKELEKILHPKVREGMKDFIKLHKDKDKIFLEVPLLFENGSDTLCDYTITLCCPHDIRKKRAIEERGIDAEIFDQIDKIQLPEHEKIKRSDFVIDASKPFEEEKRLFDAILGSF